MPPRKPRKPPRGVPLGDEAPAVPTTTVAPPVRPPTTTSQRMLTPRELANWLRVSPATVRRLVRRNALPHINVGDRVRFLASEVVEKLRKG